MNFSQFHLSFMFAFDISIFINRSSLDQFQLLRSDNRFFINFWKFLNDQNLALGPFIRKSSNSVEELLEITRRMVSSGGKNIFSPVFFSEYIPTIFKLDPRKLGFEDYEKGEKIKGLKIGLDGDLARKNIFQYDDIDLRLFRNGVLSIRVSICDIDNNQLELSAQQMIEFITKEKQYLNDVYKKLVLTISRSLREIKKAYPPLQSIDFIEQNLEITDSFIFEDRPFRFMVINPVEQKQGANRTPKIEDLADEDRKELLGVLNIAPWYHDYHDRYITKSFDDAVFYKNDEIFFCDSNAALILIPRYWENDHMVNFINNIKLVCELLNVQLVYINTLNSSIEHYLSRDSERNLKPGIEAANEIKSLILELEKTSDINAFICHGFSLNFLTKLAQEMRINARIVTIYKKMKLIDEQITLASQGKLSISQQKISKAALFATVGNFIVALTNILFNILKK